MTPEKIKRIDQIKELIGPYFRYWLKNPDREKYLFGECKSVQEIGSFAYLELTNAGVITRLEDLDDSVKFSLKASAKEILPNGTTEEGMKICKTIHVFGWFSQ